jgi:hypothetical protein
MHPAGTVQGLRNHVWRLATGSDTWAVTNALTASPVRSEPEPGGFIGSELSRTGPRPPLERSSLVGTLPRVELSRSMLRVKVRTTCSERTKRGCWWHSHGEGVDPLILLGIADLVPRSPDNASGAMAHRRPRPKQWDLERPSPVPVIEDEPVPRRCLVCLDFLNQRVDLGHQGLPGRAVRSGLVRHPLDTRKPLE